MGKNDRELTSSVITLSKLPDFDFSTSVYKWKQYCLSPRSIMKITLHKNMLSILIGRKVLFNTKYINL